MTAASDVIIYCSNKRLIVMNRFDTMLEAAEFAATLCGSYRFATSNSTVVYIMGLNGT
jgi:hypothetical protein